jgi:hypothetical protein
MTGGAIQVDVSRREGKLLSDRKFQVSGIADAESVIKRKIGDADGGESRPIVVD